MDAAGRRMAATSCPRGILAVAPHGVVSFNHALFFTDCAGWFSDGVWPVERRDLAASFLFRIPLYRDFLIALGRAASQPNQDTVRRECSGTNFL